MATSQHLRVLVLFGGRSAEHEISCLSARNVLGALRAGRHEVTTVGITREGRWTLTDVPDTPKDVLPGVDDEGETVALLSTRKGPALVAFPDDGAPYELGPVDVCFPVLHGPYGEDGTVQGLLASHGVPYVGADVASSAIGVDKRQMKRVFEVAGLPQIPYVPVTRSSWERERAGTIRALEDILEYPLFTKPARQGSSIGIARCADRDELVAGVEEAFAYDRVAIVEQAVTGARELECGVLGNVDVEVTPPGEIVTGHEFYDFEGKYLDEELILRCPADVAADVQARCQEYARRAFQAIGARGMARVDFFYLDDGRILLNEINTIPGFTPASMYPRVWAAQGVDGPELVDRLLGLALEAAESDARFAP
jgi:D-alanine-D-alanine ligase